MTCLRYLLLLVLMMAVVPVGNSQPKAEKKGFAPLLKHAENLESAKGVPGLTDAQREKLSPVIEQLRKDLVALSKIESDSSKIPPGYQKDLDLQVATLERAINAKADLKAEVRVKVITAVAASLSTKRKFAAANPKEPFIELDIKATTKNGVNEEVPGLKVNWLTESQYYLAMNTPGVPFPTNSSPARGKLPSGTYYLHAGKDPKTGPFGAWMFLDTDNGTDVDVPAP